MTEVTELVAPEERNRLARPRLRGQLGTAGPRPLRWAPLLPGARSPLASVTTSPISFSDGTSTGGWGLGRRGGQLSRSLGQVGMTSWGGARPPGRGQGGVCDLGRMRRRSSCRGPS